ncbi:hypothetical protein D3C75_1192110 [compost metagenome]
MNELEVNCCYSILLAPEGSLLAPHAKAEYPENHSSELTNAPSPNCVDAVQVVGTVL